MHKIMRSLLAVLVLGLMRDEIPKVSAQSNYASHGNDVAYIGEGLPESATLDGKVTKLDELSSEIFLNRTRATLNCGAGSMEIELKFKEKFFGIAYADFNRNSACQVVGKGGLNYKLDLPLKGCGTKQEPQRVFTNNIVVRFHPGLEMDGDEVITVVCRYPPPVAPPPVALTDRILSSTVVAPIAEPLLEGYQILLIICAILFLSLLLLGLGCSYICLKRRNVQVVRRHPFSSTGSGSEITKLSGSSLGNISMFEGLKIPRAHAAAAGSTSGSEANLIMHASGGEHSDTLPSDYPSESPSSAHSEVEDIETRSLRRPSTVSSSGSYDNKGYVHQEAMSTFFSEKVIAPPPPPEPTFDVSVRVKRAAPTPTPPMRTPSTSDVESVMDMQASKLTSILEQSHVQTPKPPTTFTYVPEIHAPPVRYQTPPVYSRILRRQQEQVQTRDAASVPDNDDWSQSEDIVDSSHRRITLTPARSLTSLNTEMTDTRSMSEIVDNSHKRYTAAPAPPPPPPMISPARYMTELDVPVSSADVMEPPVIPTRRPEITTHVVDDVFLRTITEKRTIEDVERTKRQITEYHARPLPPPVNTKWDVVIRNYPAPVQEGQQGSEPGPDWESFSETSSASGYPTTPVSERRHAQLDVQPNYLTTLEVPIKDPTVKNWDVLIRVLNPPQMESTQDIPTTEIYREEAFLTIEDREKWRQIITTESTLRTLLTEATVREDFERIRTDQRYEKLFEPQKWDVIIRVLAPPERPQYDQRGGGTSNSRYRRKTDWDTRSRRSSLPTLYEYDSDGGSSVRTLVPDGAIGVHPGMDPILRSRRTSRSSMRSDMDVRSMTEVTVDFARPDVGDNLSDVSGPSSYYRSSGPRRFYDDDDLLGGDHHGHTTSEEDYYSRRLETRSLVRSLSQPSLARSASEFTEHWVPPPDRRHWEVDYVSSPEHSPRSARSRTSAISSVSQQRPPPTALLPEGGREIIFSSSTKLVREVYEQDRWYRGDDESETSFK